LSVTTVLVDLFRHNTWANERILEVCAGLDEATLDATGDGTYGSIRATLVHLVGAQGRYVDTLQGERPQTMVWENEGWPGFETLWASARETNRTLEAIAERADGMGPIRREWRGEQVELLPSLLLTQAINHATEHRAHINTILTLVGVEPPSLDGWSWNEAGRP
jgi:uncharacterized damage-inducible protein DinB